MTQHRYKSGHKVRRVKFSNGDDAAVGDEGILLVDEPDKGVPPLWKVWCRGRVQEWDARCFEPLVSSEQLIEGDRVRHDLYGEGKINAIRQGDGVAWVYFDSVGNSQATVALNLLTKVEEPEENDELSALLRVLGNVESVSKQGGGLSLSTSEVQLLWDYIDYIREVEGVPRKRTDCYLDGHHVCEDCGNDHDCDMEDIELAAEILYCINQSQPKESTTELTIDGEEAKLVGERKYYGLDDVDTHESHGVYVGEGPDAHWYTAVYRVIRKYGMSAEANALAWRAAQAAIDSERDYRAGPEPQPSDGPEYHAEHQAWKERLAPGVYEWRHCTPTVILAGLDCGNSRRRDCMCDFDGSHDHFVDLEWSRKHPEPDVTREELHERWRKMGAEVPSASQQEKTLREKRRWVLEHYEVPVHLVDPCLDLLATIDLQHFEGVQSEIERLHDDVYNRNVTLHVDLNKRLRSILFDSPIGEE